MRILYIAEDIELPGFHGGSTHVQETINSLNELGHNVFVINKKGKNQKNIETKKQGKKRITYYHIKLPKSGLLKNIFLFVNLGRISRKIIKDKKIDFVWQRNRIFGNQGVIEGRKAGIKTIIELNEPIETSEDNLLFFIIKKWFIHCTKYADKVFGQHECELRWIKPKKKREIFTNGSNPKNFYPTKKKRGLAKKLGLKGRTFFYSGSFQDWHCLKNTIKAFKKVNQTDTTTRFLLAGEGPKKKGLEEFIKREKIKGVTFLGNIPLEELAFYINISDVCIALFDRSFSTIKKYDYFYSPVKVFDYKACAKPIIASSIGNLKTLVKNNIHGFLVDESNENEIEKAMKYLINNKKKAKDMGNKNLKEVIEKYNWKKITEQIIKITLDK